VRAGTLRGRPRRQLPHAPRRPGGPTIAAETREPAGPGDDVAGEPIVDWGRTARRLRAILLVIGGVVLALWVVTGVLGDGPSLRSLAELVGLGLLAAFVVEVVVVGGSAVRGLLRAGERGDRLAGEDVSLLPPQLLRRRR
jgi:hypothetical protein